MLIALLVPLALASLVFTVVLLRAAIRKRAAPTFEAMILGAVTNFFDTLGIGSFAPTMAWFKFRRLVPDRLIPQTLLCGLTPPAMTARRERRSLSTPNGSAETEKTKM